MIDAQNTDIHDQHLLKQSAEILHAAVLYYDVGLNQCQYPRAATVVGLSFQHGCAHLAVLRNPEYDEDAPPMWNEQDVLLVVPGEEIRHGARKWAMLLMDTDDEM